MLGHMSLTTILIYVIVIIVSLTLHEMMHAFTGHALGDDTAAEEGRISLNPLRHIDLYMTVLLPIATLVLFGMPVLAAKPVPFDPRNVKWDEFGGALIAAAGPFTNLLLAIIGAVILPHVAFGTLLYETVAIFAVTNVSLFVFNLIPIPPLDGSRILYAFAPDGLRRVMQQIEPYGLFVVLAVVVMGGASFISRLVYMVLDLLGISVA